MLRPFFSALRFLTVLPIPESWCGDETDFKKSPDWYPLAGLLIGLLLVIADSLLCRLLPLPVAGVLLLMVMIIISGALHLDGLADSADAFFSGRGRPQMLEIMKDSCSGPMGVVTVVLILLLKFTLILSLPKEFRWQTILLMPVAGRSVLPVISSWLPYARGTGTAAFTANRFGRVRLSRALLLLSLLCIAFLGLKIGVFIVLTVCLFAWLSGHYSRRKIGGFTGDTLGATCELVELLPPLCVVIAAHLGMI